MILPLFAALIVAAAAAPQDDPDARADRKRDEMIEDLRAILPRMPEGDRRADLWFQLAELWWEKARYTGLLEVRDHDQAVARWAEKRDGEEPKLDVRRSEGYRKEALRLYQEL